MKPKFISLTSLLGAALAMTLACAPAPAAVLFNAGPAPNNYNVTGFTISDPYAVTDSFTLGGPATITGVNFGLWAFPPETLVSVDWAITTSPFGGATLASGTATSFTSTAVPPPSGAGFYTVTTEELSITPLAVAAGTYWLQFAHALGTNGLDVFWDNSVETGNGQQKALDNGEIVNRGFTQTFQILGSRDVAAVPLPAALPLFATGLGALGLLGWRRKRRAALAA